jgi:hypothetical protein
MSKYRSKLPLDISRVVDLYLDPVNEMRDLDRLIADRRTMMDFYREKYSLLSHIKQAYNSGARQGARNMYARAGLDYRAMRARGKEKITIDEEENKYRLLYFKVRRELEDLLLKRQYWVEMLDRRY